MKKLLYIFFIVAVQSVSSVHGAQIAKVVQRSLPVAGKRIEQISALTTKVQDQQTTQQKLRKKLYLKCTVGAALLATAVGFGYACSKSKTSVMQPAQPVARQYGYADYYGMAKIAGLLGSVVGVIKSWGSLWHDFSHFWSIKEDITMSLEQQKEMQAEQKIMHELLLLVQEMLEERDAVDTKRWQENQATLADLKQYLERIDKNQDNFKGAVKKQYKKLKIMLNKIYEHQKKLSMLQNNHA